MAITPSRQRNAVSEGIALGFLMCGRDTIPWDKVAMDLAFQGGWRSWKHKRSFSQVDTAIRNGLDGVWVMTHADERKHTFNFYWQTDGAEIAIYARNVWANEDVDAEQAARWIDGDISTQEWQQLAADFLQRFEK